MTRTRWILLAIVGLLSVLASMLFRGDLPAAEVDAKYSNDASRFLPMENGARVHYRDEGNAAGAAVVLIHGAMASLHTWEPWVTILGQQYRVITLDLPAHGLTGQVPEHAYGADAFTETIHAVVNELGVERFVLGGNSMGGGATWRYALAYPERVQAMIWWIRSPPAIGANPLQPRQPRTMPMPMQHAPHPSALRYYAKAGSAPLLVIWTLHH